MLLAMRAGRAFVVVLPLAAAAAYAGCKSSEDTAPGDGDAGVEAATSDSPTGSDAPGSDAPPPKIDCAKDLDADGIYKHLECTGLYSDFAKKTIAADAKPYKPALELWSDGAEKSRFLMLPAGSKIDISDFDEWKFPVGTKVWKEFKIGGKLVETRLFFKASADWKHTSYRWNAAENDAVRKDEGESITFAGRASPYEMPTVGECDVCHGGRKDQLLGVEAVSLALPGATGLTLASLAADGKLSATPPFTTLKLPENAEVDGGDGGLAAPAIGWMHANCGSCHNGNATAAAVQTGLLLLVRPSQIAPEAGPATVEQLDTWTTAVNHNSTRYNDDAGAYFVRIVGGNPDASLVSILAGRRVPNGTGPNPSVQMPPLVSRMVDAKGHKLLTDWITVIPP